MRGLLHERVVEAGRLGGADDLMPFAVRVVKCPDRVGVAGRGSVTAVLLGVLDELGMGVQEKSEGC